MSWIASKENQREQLGIVMVRDGEGWGWGWGRVGGGGVVEAGSSLTGEIWGKRGGWRWIDGAAAPGAGGSTAGGGGGVAISGGEGGVAEG